MRWSRTKSRGATVAVAVVAAVASGTWSPAAHAGGLSSDPRLNTPGFDGAVHAIAHRGSTVYVGGAFQSVTDSAGQTFVRHGAAAFDSSTGQVLPWDPDVNGPVHDVVVVKEGVFLAGEFSSVDAITRLNLARVSREGTGRLHGFNRATNGPVLTVAVTRDRVYLGGSFTTVNNRARQGAAAVRRKGNHAVTRWDPNATGGSVHEIAVLNRGILLGGAFSAVSGYATAGHLAKVTDERGALVSGFDADVTAPVYDVALRGKMAFVAAGGPAGGFVAAYSRSSGRRSWLQRFDGDAVAIAAGKRTLYVGGHFNEFCKTLNTAQSNGDCLDGGYDRSKLAALRLDGRLRSWNPGANTPQGVLAVTAKPSRRWVAVGGVFTEVAGVPRARLALFG